MNQARVDTVKLTVNDQMMLRLPKSLCESLGIYPDDQFEVVMLGGTIGLARYTPSCRVCNEDCDVQKFNNTYLCGECRDVLIANLGLAHLNIEAHSQAVEAVAYEVILEKGGLKLIK